ncbi:MAG: mechanosensitive ion channel [Pseudomonadales bacterium]
MDFEAEQLLQEATGLWQRVVDLASQMDILLQLAIVAVAYGVALVLSWKLEPPFEERARAIKGNPGLLRLVIALLRRLEWVFLVAFLGVALLILRAIGWPENTGLSYTALLLVLAWLVISVLSHTVRSRALSRLIAIVVWSYVALLVLGIASEAAALLDDAGFTVGNIRISLLLVIKTVVVLSTLLWIAFGLGNFLDNRIQRSDELTPSMRVLIGKVLKITLVVLATMIALSGLGLDLTMFTVFSGAVGVGVGFGLQKVVSNFISGIIILLDRSIKPGDTISLGETFGWIRELRARFVSVVTRDGREYLIPNEDFITREVINWSFSDELVRLDVPFGVSYNSDPHQVSALAIEAASTVDRVVSGRNPVCWLTGFGDSSLDFLLRFWIRDPQNGLTNVRGQVLLAVWDAFKEHGVNIPYPHREIIMKAPQTDV